MSRGYTERECPLEINRTRPKTDRNKLMRAAEWHGTECIRVCERPRPVVTEPRDAIIRVTSTTLDGSDLHMYLNLVPGLDRGTILGHEFMGIIEDVGPGVNEFNRGDRVVVSSIIACGNCEFCKKGAYSCCDMTNPSMECESTYGHRTAGRFGNTHLRGGYPGGQAEFVRVPIADVNLLKIPDSVPDDKALMLSNLVCTAWHANVLGKVKQGHTVAVWGCGPVGLMTLALAKFRGANKLIAIDNVPERLRLARKVLGAHTVNFDDVNVEEALDDLTDNGPDVAIETAGFRFPKSFVGKLSNLVRGHPADSLDILNEQVRCVKKNGVIVLVGDYYGVGNNFNIGALMEKCLTLRTGHVFVQKYWKELLGYIESGQFDPTFVITHRISLEDIPHAYRMSNRHLDGMIKVLVDVNPSKRNF